MAGACVRRHPTDGRHQHDRQRRATLFNNAGNGHQIKVNKQALADTASLLFQTNWSGGAEMGKGGSDEFVIKVGPDANSWLMDLQVSSKGVVTTSSRSLARASLVAEPSTPANGTRKVSRLAIRSLAHLETVSRCRSAETIS